MIREVFSNGFSPEITGKNVASNCSVEYEERCRRLASGILPSYYDFKAAKLSEEAKWEMVRVVMKKKNRELIRRFKPKWNKRWNRAEKKQKTLLAR